MLALYGHKFSSYTWKALIPLYANETEFEFRDFPMGDPEREPPLMKLHPGARFPILFDGDRTIIEATSIVEYLALHHPGPAPLLPDDRDAALEMRMLDRVFDNYVMGSAQKVVNAFLRDAESPDPVELEAGRAGLLRAYAWLENWLGENALPPHVSLVTCAAAPALFYGDWVERIPDECPKVAGLRSDILSLEPVARCV